MAVQLVNIDNSNISSMHFTVCILDRTSRLAFSENLLVRAKEKVLRVG